MAVSLSPGWRFAAQQKGRPRGHVGDWIARVYAITHSAGSCEHMRVVNQLECGDLRRREANLAQQVQIKGFDVALILNDSVSRAIGHVIGGKDGRVGSCHKVRWQPSLWMSLQILSNSKNVRHVGIARPWRRANDEAVEVLGSTAQR